MVTTPPANLRKHYRTSEKNPGSEDPGYSILAGDGRLL